ncbi:oligosaccharide flippase family protein [Lapidilactobacillus gannanensis]|uniref:Oligosaccharide flippase family protein n=1 Tax=Lapidilactobacillus gannanensis TaxID=2486002 RepID=A0ABW4BMM3_9LACO|nr:oligosaccharide flippase family protein [Lapidilactobacillus gannanensis]
MKVFKNFIYTSGYQIFSIIVPIITAPYISRQLGPSGVGINAFSLSFVQVFVLFAYLGTQKYGNKMISKERNNVIQLTTNFKYVYFNQLVTTTLTLFLYILYVEVFIDKYRSLYFVQAIYILSVYFDVSWFFQGKEDFRTTVVRGMGSKVLGTILIFILIHDPQDITLYALILAASGLVANVIMWMYLWKEIDWTRFIKIRIQLKPFLIQLKNIFTYFVPVAFLQITVLMYQLILGWHASNIEVAYYANANKIITIPLYIITSFITVMFPRMSYEFGSGRENHANELLKSSVETTMLLAIPLTFGMIAISSNFVGWFFGAGFTKVSPVMIILSLRIVPATLNEVFGYLLLMANGKATLYSRSLSIGGAVSIVLNYLVTFHSGAVSTAWVSVISEFLIMIVILLFVRSRIGVLKNVVILHACIFSVLMFIPVYLFGSGYERNITVTIVQIILAVVIYSALLVIFDRKKIREILATFKN